MQDALAIAVALAAALWLCYRIVNVPRFADFLIAVEAEMAKVSWPTGDEVARSSAVIICLIFALAGILAAYDLFWWFVLRYVLQVTCAGRRQPRARASHDRESR